MNAADGVLKEREKNLERAAISIEERILTQRQPSPFSIAARDALRQAAAAVAQARAVTGEQRLKLLRVSSAFADAGEALRDLGGCS